MQKYLIVATPRSATAYVSALLTELGFHCGHERYFGLETRLADFLGAEDVAGECSWLAVPTLLELPEDVRILHQVRDPLKVIRSMLEIQFLDLDALGQPTRQGDRGRYTQFALRHCPEVREYPTELERAAWFYYYWNRRVDTALGDRVVFRYRVEALDAALLRRLLKAAGLDGEGLSEADLERRLAAVPRNVNAKLDDKVLLTEEVTWTALPEPVRELARSYGYGPPAEASRCASRASAGWHETFEQLREQIRMTQLAEMDWRVRRGSSAAGVGEASDSVGTVPSGLGYERIDHLLRRVQAAWQADGQRTAAELAGAERELRTLRLLVRELQSSLRNGRDAVRAVRAEAQQARREQEAQWRERVERLAAQLEKAADGRRVILAERQELREEIARGRRAVEQAQEQRRAVEGRLASKEANLAAARERAHTLRRSLDGRGQEVSGERRLRRQREAEARRRAVELKLLREEVRYRLGDALVRAARPSVDTLKLPVRICKLAVEGLRRRAARRRAAELQPSSRPAQVADRAAVSERAAARTPAASSSLPVLAPPAFQHAAVLPGPQVPTHVVFEDSLEDSWGPWRPHQRVRLEAGGVFVIDQGDGTPGLRRSSTEVNRSASYELACEIQCQMAEGKVFLWARDEESGEVLSATRYITEAGRPRWASTVFRTLHGTRAITVGVSAETPTIGDRVCVRRVKLLERVVGRPGQDSRQFPDRLRPEDTVASLASIPGREPMLYDTVASLYPQVDQLRVFLNGYEHVPSFLRDPRIVVGRSQDYGDNGDAGKFFWVDQDHAGYRFICDDDLVFPHDYVATMIARLKTYNNRAVVGVHGILLKQPLENYYDGDSRHVYRYVNAAPVDHCVHVLGTGAIAYHASVFAPRREDFQYRNMADIWLAARAQREKVPLICIQRPRNWLVQNRMKDAAPTIYDHSVEQRGTVFDTSMVQTNVVHSIAPITIMSPTRGRSRAKKLVLGITTYNRREYLQACIESWLATRSEDYHWALVIADDGSTDDTLEYVRSLQMHHEVHLIRNERRYCVGQTNSIFRLCARIGFDVGFKVDDDLAFTKPGWDHGYVNAIDATGYDHLCYLNHEHFVELRRRENSRYVMPERILHPSGTAEAYVDVSRCMGALFTFTPRLLERVGYADEANFPIRGQWHIDYSTRCCRAGFNVADTFLDMKDSNEYLDLQNNLREDYRCSIAWGDEYKKTKESQELARRQAVINDASRIFVADPARPARRVRRQVGDWFERVVVLNLDRRPDRLEAFARRAEAAGLKFERFVATDGNCEPAERQWEAYTRSPRATLSSGVRPVRNSYEYYRDHDSDVARVVYLEQKLGRPAIQTPGAWGYLLTMKRLLEQAIREEWESVLVLDDDVVFHEDFSDAFRKIAPTVPDDWKILQLGTLQYHWEYPWISWLTPELYMCCGSSTASHAVGVRRSVFPMLLNYTDRFDLPYDEGALHTVKYRYSRQCFTCFPNLVIQDTTESDINSSAVQQDEGDRQADTYRWTLSDYDWQRERVGVE